MKNKNNDYRALETYYDKDCIDRHCDNGRLRSFDDVYIVLRTYFPYITVLEVFDIIMRSGITVNGQKQLPSFASCGAMARIRITYNAWWSKLSKAHLESQYDSKYSWADLIEMKWGVRQLEQNVSDNIQPIDYNDKSTFVCLRYLKPISFDIDTVSIKYSNITKITTIDDVEYTKQEIKDIITLLKPAEYKGLVISTKTTTMVGEHKILTSKLYKTLLKIHDTE